MKQNKIGILTYYWAENPGTFLQAYSLQESIRKIATNANVEIIGYRHRHVFFKPSAQLMVKGQLSRDIKKYFVYKNYRRKYLNESPQTLITKDSNKAWRYIDKQKYDLIIVGSDTILQFLRFHYINNTIPVYWLPSRLKCIKALCAASAGVQTTNALSKNQREQLKTSLEGFQFIGIRDDALNNLICEVNPSVKEKVEIVPDPTFSYLIDYSYIENLLISKSIDLSKPMVLLSLTAKFPLGKSLCQAYKDKGYQVLSIRPFPHADIHLNDITPFEWAGLFKYVDIVYTQSFHDTLFSLRNETPVVTIVSSKKSMTHHGHSKYLSLLKQFELDKTNYYCAIDNPNLDVLIQLGTNALTNINHNKILQTNKLFEQRYYSFIKKVVSCLS